MDNVSTGGGALRFGPHGLKFKKPVKVTLPIDAARMPAGMTSGDVVAFFFDEASGKWTQLPKVSGRSDRIVARDDALHRLHRLDGPDPRSPRRAAVQPEHDEGREGGRARRRHHDDPAARGELAAGRRASAIRSRRRRRATASDRTLALTYDSDRVNANGWLGVGWDLRMSSIEIDTRFGVPKYDATDIYSLDGAMLAPISTAGKYITARTRASCRWRDRLDPAHGDRADDLLLDGHGQERNRLHVRELVHHVRSRLRTPATTSEPANIFRWYLEKVQDAYGNVMTITYQHDTVHDGDRRRTRDLRRGLSVRHRLHEQRRRPGGELPRHVQLADLDDPRHAARHASITARPGFLVSTRRRLADIIVKSGTTVVRQYQFVLRGVRTSRTRCRRACCRRSRCGARERQRASELYRHTFEYNKAPAIGGMFAPQQTWGPGRDPQQGPDRRRALPCVDNLGGGSVTLGVGFPSISVTGSFGMDFGVSTPDLRFLGVTGEGLPDQVEVRRDDEPELHPEQAWIRPPTTSPRGSSPVCRGSAAPVVRDGRPAATSARWNGRSGQRQLRPARVRGQRDRHGHQRRRVPRRRPGWRFSPGVRQRRQGELHAPAMDRLQPLELLRSLPRPE